MALKFYNSLTRRVEDFVPLEPGKVRMYNCGPTVYDFIGIHNARTFVNFDLLRRYLEYKGYHVTYAQNVTDIEDKIIQRANERGKDPLEWARTYADAFFEDVRGLGVQPPDIAPHATGTIPEMLDLIHRLMKLKAAYSTNSGVYYRVEAFSGYGKLSGRTPDDVRAGARVEVDEEKDDPRDFALWKRAKIGEPWWDSPWGQGRPGWHIECSAMVMKHLGETIDIHSGGADLTFPHHENEIAQSEKATGKPFARYWLHGALMRVDGRRMGKSEGNFVRLRDALEKYPVEAIRLWLMSTHYRKPLDYTPTSIEEHIPPARRLNTCLDALEKASAGTAPALALPEGREGAGDPSVRELLAAITQAKADFEAIVDDDFNIPGGLGVLFELVTAANRFVQEHPQPTDAERRAIATAAVFLGKVADVLGLRAVREKTAGGRLKPLVALAVELLKEESQEGRLSDAGLIRSGDSWELAPETDAAKRVVDLLLSVRQEARAAKNWARSDQIRDRLTEIGLVLKDTRVGTEWEWSSS